MGSLSSKEERERDAASSVATLLSLSRKTQEETSELGTSLRGSSRPVPLSSRFPFPRLPRFDECPVPKTPAPPRLEAIGGPPQWAAAMVKAYREVVARRTGKKCFVLSKGDITTSRFYDAIVATAEALISYELSPIQWAWFCCVTWEEGEAKRGSRKKLQAPPVTAVFNPARVHEHHGWCASMTQGQFGGQFVYTDAHKEIFQRYKRMKYALVLCRSIEEATKVVNEHLPAELYESLKQKANEQAAVIQRRLRDKVRRGEWIWG